MRNHLLFAVTFCLIAASARADFPDMVKIAESTVDPTALTIDGVYGQSINGEAFQQDAVTSFKGWQYVVYYDADRHLALARRKLPSGDWQIIRFTDYHFKGDDAHNTASMGICPKDGTIHLAFDHHGNPLHYRVSQKGVALHPDNIKWSPDLFSAVTDTLEKPAKDVTYPGFLQTPEGNLQFLYRNGTSGHGQRWMVDYDGDTGKWAHTREIDTGDGTFKDNFNESRNRNAYPNGFDYGPSGRLYYTWVWRENTQGANHDLLYAYSDDRGFTWHNNAGALINDGTGKMVINIHTPGLVVVSIDRSRTLMNQQAQAVDSKGHIHVVVWHGKDGDSSHGHPYRPLESSYFHYWRDDNGKWLRSEIPSEVGNRPKLFFDKGDNAYLIFTVNRDPAHWSHDIYYTDGELRIAAATAAAHWTDWKVIVKDPGHYMNELMADGPRFHSEGILSIMVQDTPAKPREATPLRILDYKIKG
jgi:hypothetical protein